MGNQPERGEAFKGLSDFYKSKVEKGDNFEKEKNVEIAGGGKTGLNDENKV